MALVLEISSTVTEEAVAALSASLVDVYRRVDIYEADNVTPFAIDAPAIDGSISVDGTRAERRTLDLTLDNGDGLYRSNPDAFWYDKVIRVYRGLFAGTTRYEFCLGTFLIDSISSPHFPHTTHVTARDFTKKLMQVKFGQATTFGNGLDVGSVLSGIAVAGGVTNYNIPSGLGTLGIDFAYEASVARWDAIKEVAVAHQLDVYFDPQGVLTARPMVDPLTAATVWTFQTGSLGNLASYTEDTNDSNVFNDFVVVGKATNSPSVYGRATNTEPSSPTRVDRLGYRTAPPYESALVTTAAQADALALAFLKVQGLESYSIDMEAIVVPWLEANTAVTFLDPDPVLGLPTSFLLSTFTLPVMLGTMQANARRITIVG